MATVVVVDDHTTSREILAELIRSIGEDMSVESFGDPAEALAWTQENPVDLVLTDYNMPDINGIEFLRSLRSSPHNADIPVVMVTSLEDRHVRYEALDAGASDFLTKPVDQYECRARCANLLALRRQQLATKDRAKWLERQVLNATREIRQREEETLLRLAKAGEYRDEETGNHVLRMARYSRLIAEALGLAEDHCRVIEWAAPMHDIGKIGIPDNILLKPGSHTPDESELMKRHTLIGFEILKESPSQYLQLGAVIALGHHEKFDGGGYPRGIRGEDIPLAARIVAVADVFDALTSERPYKAAWAIPQALDYLDGARESHFDPDCVDAFLAQIDRVTTICEDLKDDINPYRATQQSDAAIKRKP